MKSRLLIVRNPESTLLNHLDTNRGNQEIILIQNGVFSSVLRDNGGKLLDIDAKARNIETNENTVDYDKLLDSILKADQVITV